MREIDAIIRDAEKRAETLFDKRPKSSVVAQPFPTFRKTTLLRITTLPRLTDLGRVFISIHGASAI
jgi:hypothetical protein